jgi:hypothetical protein
MHFASGCLHEQPASHAECTPAASRYRALELHAVRRRGGIIPDPPQHLLAGLGLDSVCWLLASVRRSVCRLPRHRLVQPRQLALRHRCTHGAVPEAAAPRPCAATATPATRCAWLPATLGMWRAELWATGGVESLCNRFQKGTLLPKCLSDMQRTCRCIRSIEPYVTIMDRMHKEARLTEIDQADRGRR